MTGLEDKGVKMQNKRITLTIHTCDKFSDIWDASLGLINKNWSDRDMRTILVTDEKTEKTFDGIEVFSAGKSTDMPMRTKRIISEIKTEYVFFTLDDYLIIDKVDNEKINKLITIMDQYNIDYLVFGDGHKTKRLIDKEEQIFELDLFSGEDYIVNLYPSIWRKSFMEKTLIKPQNIWDYEVSLTKIAQKENAICCTAKGKQFTMMDTIRKGKFLHKSYKYLKQNNLYEGGREVISYWIEIKLFIMDTIRHNLPRPVVIIMKKIMKIFGYKFFSD